MHYNINKQCNATLNLNHDSNACEMVEKKFG